MMKIISKQELETILTKHAKWLCDKEVGERANLRDADLSGADLSFANLRGANLHDADLSGANLRDANLRGADLSSADLSFADLSGADLSSADLSSASFNSADLNSADLSFADLSGADLRSANLSDANLRDANLVVFQSSRHQAFYTSDGTLRIGCEVMSIADWSEFYEEIGLANDYSQMDIIAYGGFIKICLEMFNETYPKCEQR